jgi:uncharacterized protein
MAEHITKIAVAGATGLFIGIVNAAPIGILSVGDYVEAELRIRTDTLGQFVTALGCLSHRPATLIAASSVGAYGLDGRSDVPVDETYPAGRHFWGQDSVAMEQAALAAQAHGIRTVVLRTGYVIDRHNLDFQLQPFNHHFGGRVGTGRGWIPWIHMNDEAGTIAFALQHPGLDGPVNLVAPGSIRLREFSRTLGGRSATAPGCRSPLRLPGWAWASSPTS